jgi:hypothetical protein
VTALVNPVTGHQIQVDDTSTEFWKASGYRDVEKPKATAKKTSASKSKK